MGGNDFPKIQDHILEQMSDSLSHYAQSSVIRAEEKMHKMKQESRPPRPQSSRASAYRLDDSKRLPAISCTIGTSKSLSQTKLIFFSKPVPPSLFSNSVMNPHSSKCLDIRVFSAPHPVLPQPCQFYLPNIFQIHLLSIPTHQDIS